MLAFKQPSTSPPPLATSTPPNGHSVQQQDLATRITACFSGDDTASAVKDILAVASIPGVSLIDLRQTVVQKRLTLVIELEVSSSSRDEAILYKSLLSVAHSMSLSVDCEFSVAPSPSPSHAAKTPIGLENGKHGNNDDITPVNGSNSPGGTEKSNGTDTSSTNKADSAKTKTTDDNSNTTPVVTKPKTLPIASFMRNTPSQYVITLLSRTSIPPRFLSTLADDLSTNGLVVESMSRLSAMKLRCLELQVAATHALTPASVLNVRKRLYALGKESNLDVALQAESVSRRSKRLVVFDMDSTLIQQEVIDELARYAGVYDAVCEITHRAMSGQLDFKQSLAERVKLLRGADASLYQNVITNLHYTPGVKLLCRTLKRLGYRLAVISGGFTAITSHVRNELGLDYDYANNLEVVNGKFTGNTVGPIVTARRKADLLMTIAQLENITLDQVIAIGDGANDLPMLGTAGLGIAFNAKPKVQEAASFRINQPSILTVLYLLGLSEQDQEELSGHGSIRTNGSGSVSSLHDIAD